MNSSDNAENGSSSIFQEIEAITLTERVIAALVTLGYALGSLMNHAHLAGQPRQAGPLVHASASAHPTHHH